MSQVVYDALVSACKADKEGKIRLPSYNRALLYDMVDQFAKHGELSTAKVSYIRDSLKRIMPELIKLGLVSAPATTRNVDNPSVSVTTPMGHRLATFHGSKRIAIDAQDMHLYVDSLHTLHQFKRDKATGLHTCALTLDAVNELERQRFTISPELLDWRRNATSLQQPVTLPVFDTLKRAPFPYQAEAVARLERANGRLLIADEMGLGKTLTAIAFCATHNDALPALVLCPAALKVNWAREIIATVHKPRVQVLSGRGALYIDDAADWVICNYDIASAHVEQFDKFVFRTIVMDECHYIQNKAANRTKAALAAAKNSPHVIAISGTPVTSQAINMFNALNMVAPHVFYSWHKYANTYTNRKSGYRGSITYTGVRNAEQLNELLRSTCMIRRKKQDVLTQLPPKQYFMVPLDITNRSEYMKMEQGVIESIDEGTSELEAGARFEKLRQLAVEGRMTATLEWIEEFLAAGRKLIVMAVHRKTVEMLHKHFPLISVYVYGGVTDAHRQDAVDRFQKDDKVRLFIGNIQAAGVGLTLTAASDVAFMELPWTPGELGQAQDRAHRIGQTRQVSIWYIVSSDTVDEEIAAILSRKQRELEQLLDGKVDADTSTVSELIRKYKKGTRV